MPQTFGICSNSAQEEDTEQNSVNIIYVNCILQLNPITSLQYVYENITLPSVSVGDKHGGAVSL